MGPRKMCGSFLWKLRQGGEAVELLGKRPLFLPETYACCKTSWMGSSESTWNYCCLAKENKSVFKKSFETESWFIVFLNVFIFAGIEFWSSSIFWITEKLTKREIKYFKGIQSTLRSRHWGVFWKIDAHDIWIQGSKLL